MLRGLNGSVMLNQALDSVDPSELTVSDYTAGQIKQQYKQRLVECGNTLNVTLPETSHAYPYYDAMWAFAIGFHIGLNSGDPLFGSVHNAILNNVSFQGVSSWIDFRNRHHVSNSAKIIQVAGSTTIKKGHWNRTILTYANETFISDEFKTESVILHPALAVSGFLISTVLLVVTIFVQIMMIVYRDYPSLKASSTRLNHFIYLGCYLFTTSIICSTFRLIIPAAKGNVLCNVDILSSTLASSLIFGTVLAKSWRTYKIFNQVFKARSHYSLHDATLATFIVSTTIVQGILFVPMLVLSPLTEVISFEFDSTQWPPVKRLKSVCVIKSVGYIVLPLIFQLSLILATVFLATLIRNVRRKNFRTTKQIIMLVYILMIIWAIGGPLLVLFHHLNFSVNITYLFYTFLLVVTVAFCLILLIIPFLLPAFKEKKVSNRRGSYFTEYSRSSTRLSILSYRRLSSPINNAFRRYSVRSQSDSMSPSELIRDRRSSLPPTTEVQTSRTHTFRTLSLRRSSCGSQVSIQSCSTSLQTVSDNQSSSIRHGTLQSISESTENNSYC